jgi:hypothetical protein
MERLWQSQYGSVCIQRKKPLANAVICPFAFLWQEVLSDQDAEEIIKQSRAMAKDRAEEATSSTEGQRYRINMIHYRTSCFFTIDADKYL